MDVQNNKNTNSDDITDKIVKLIMDTYINDDVIINLFAYISELETQHILAKPFAALCQDEK